MDLAKIRKKSKNGDTQPQDVTKDLPTEDLKFEGEAAQTEPPPQVEAGDDAPPDTPEGGPTPEARESKIEVPPAELAGSEVAEQQIKTSEPANREKMLLFAVGKERYAMPIQDISLIIEKRFPTPIPNVPYFVQGIISLRGKIVTILNAAERLGLRTGGQGETAKIVVIDKGADQFGILVDNIEHVVEVDRGLMEPSPESFSRVEQEFVNGVFYNKDKAIASLDLERFLDFKV